MVAALTLWGLPTIYFLTHRITTPYYAIPATFGTALLLALGALTIECCSSPATSRPRSTVGIGLCGVALVLALFPGVAALKRSWFPTTRYAAPLERPARHFVLPTELSSEQAWVWADLLTGTLWYYANKPAFKVGFADPKTRALAYRFVYERGAHSIGFSGRGYHHSAKAARGEDLQIEQPVACGDFPAFDFHTTLAGVLGTTLVGDQVVQVC
jgi:hypothetical protein